MNDRFNFRAGFTVPYIDDNGDDRDIQLFIKGYFSVECGGAGIVVHSSIIDEALKNTDLSFPEKLSVGEYIENNYCETEQYWFIDNPDFLEQCTGLKDKNGKLIYEGDIVKRSGQAFIVEWRQDRLSFVLSNYKNLFESYDITHFDWEIISNIHENAELIK